MNRMNLPSIIHCAIYVGVIVTLLAYAAEEPLPASTASRGTGSDDLLTAKDPIRSAETSGGLGLIFRTEGKGHGERTMMRDEPMMCYASRLLEARSGAEVGQATECFSEDSPSEAVAVLHLPDGDLEVRSHLEPSDRPSSHRSSRNPHVRELRSNYEVNNLRGTGEFANVRGTARRNGQFEWVNEEDGTALIRSTFRVRILESNTNPRRVGASS